MIYPDIVQGQFIARPNRFIAHVLLGGVPVIAHVPNTGRCRELLVPGATVYLAPAQNPARKTKFSLVAVEKQGEEGSILINMDSQAPNQILAEALASGQPVPGFPHPLQQIQREYTHGNSRLDFRLTSSSGTTLVEVKGVTLEDQGAVFFPDAPTPRGLKHLEELTAAALQGQQTIVCFIIQLATASYFSPNNRTHPAFGQALLTAQQAGVTILAFTTQLTPGEITLGQPVALRL